jgi:hypothetical protein
MPEGPTDLDKKSSIVFINQAQLHLGDDCKGLEIAPSAGVQVVSFQQVLAYRHRCHDFGCHQG